MITRRKKIRLKNFDYSQAGCYFVTICTKDRVNHFGNIVKDKLNLNELGKIAFECWKEIPNHFDYTILDEFVVMPNHVHGILAIVGDAYMHPYKIRQK